MVRSIPFLSMLLVLSNSPAFSTQIQSIADGDYENPLTWDCSCIPYSGDTISIFHHVTKTTYDEIDGSLTVDHNASLSGPWIQLKGKAFILGDINTAALWINAFTEVYVNHGSGHTLVATYLALFGNSTLEIEMLSSLYVNNVEGTGSIRNRGSVNIGLVLSLSDLYIENLGSGLLTIQAMDESFDLYANAISSTVLTGNIDFSFLHLEDDAQLTVNGDVVTIGLQMDSPSGIPRIEIQGDWTNEGTSIGSGQICISGYTSNVGSISPAPFQLLDICDLSPTSTQWPFLDSNTGSVDSGVSFCSSGSYCVLSTQEIITSRLDVYPNPFSDRITVKGSVELLELIDLSGRVIHASNSNELQDLQELPRGIYLIRAQNSVTRVVKE